MSGSRIQNSSLDQKPQSRKGCKVSLQKVWGPGRIGTCEHAWSLRNKILQMKSRPWNASVMNRKPQTLKPKPEPETLKLQEELDRGWTFGFKDCEPSQLKARGVGCCPTAMPNETVIVT